MIQITFAEEEIPMLIEACGELKTKYGYPLIQRIQAAQAMARQQSVAAAVGTSSLEISPVGDFDGGEAPPRPPRKPVAPKA